jgi:hypothetical protein
VIAYAPGGTAVPMSGGWSGASAVIAQRVSRDGTRLVAVVRDGDRYAVWGAGIQRDRAGAPTALVSPVKKLATLSDAATDLTWLDASTLGVLAGAGQDQYVEAVHVGGFPDAPIRTPGDTSTLSGQSSNASVIDTDGELYAQRGANWQQLMGGVRVLAVQQGMPR